MMRSVLRPAAVAAALAAVAWHPAAGQRVLDPLGDATLPRPGEIRVGLGGRWEVFDRVLPRAAGGGAQPLGDGVVAERLDDRFAGFVQDGLRRAVGDTSIAFTAGAMRGSIEARNWTVPLSVEVGVTRWLSVQATLPVVQPFTSVFLRPNPPGTFANLGRNAIGTNTAAGAAANQALLLTIRQVNDVLIAVGTARPECGVAAPPASCAPVLALRGVGTDLSLGLGVGFTGPFAPLAGSRADTLLAARFAAFNAAARAVLGGTSDPVTARPTLAAARMGMADFQALVLGGGFDSLGSRRRILMGDATVGGTVRLFDTFGATDSARRAASGFRIRSSLRGLLVLGTGHIPATRSWVDQGSGSNARGVDLRWATDIMASRAAWLTAAVQMRRWASETMPLATVFTNADRTPFGVDRPGLVDGMGPWTGATGLSRQRGTELTVDVVPRWMLTDYLAVQGAWRWRRRNDDTFTYIGPIDAAIPASDLRPAGLDGVLALGGSEQRVGVGLTFSTRAAKRPSGGGLPVEVSYLHQQVLSGTNLPKTSLDALQLRWYWGLTASARR
jgi:hypothetical protein